MLEIEAYKFCPKCGSKKFVKKADNLLHCEVCDFRYYINARPCMGAILLNSQNQILLAKRAIQPHFGTWDLPGGFVDLGETYEQATVREIKEELGIKISDVKIFGSYTDTYNFSGLDFQTLAVMTTATIDSPLEKIKPQDDVSEVKFFNPNQIPFDNIGFNAIKLGIKDFITANNL